MSALFHYFKMNELETRLRFFVSENLAKSLRDLLHTSRMQPFGSSVNGIGNFDSDLDLSLILNYNENSPKV